MAQIMLIKSKTGTVTLAVYCLAKLFVVLHICGWVSCNTLQRCIVLTSLQRGEWYQLVSTLANAAALVDEDLILGGLNRLKAIPASDKVVLIHWDIVSLLATFQDLTCVTNKLVTAPLRGLVHVKYSFISI